MTDSASDTHGLPSWPPVGSSRARALAGWGRSLPGVGSAREHMSTFLPTPGGQWSLHAFSRRSPGSWLIDGMT